MAGTTRLSSVLDHLEWLREQLQADVNASNCYAGALFTYNAAVALQWHFVLPVDEGDVISDAQGRENAANVIDDFVWRSRELFRKCKPQGQKSFGRNASRSLLAAQCAAISAPLKSLPKLFCFPEPEPIQRDDLLATLNLEAMLRTWLNARGIVADASGESFEDLDLSETQSTMLASLTLASELFDRDSEISGNADYRSGSSEVLAQILQAASRKHATTVKGESAKRIRAFTRDIVQNLNALRDS